MSNSASQNMYSTRVYWNLFIPSLRQLQHQSTLHPPVCKVGQFCALLCIRHFISPSQALHSSVHPALTYNGMSQPINNITQQKIPTHYCNKASTT